MTKQELRDKIQEAAALRTLKDLEGVDKINYRELGNKWGQSRQRACQRVAQAEKVGYIITKNHKFEYTKKYYEKYKNGKQN